MPANETPLGFVSYPDKQTPQWYTDDGDTMGLESWLAQMELLGLPTYATFTDLPDASTTPSHGDAQQQFAAVAADRTVYRSDGTEWVPFMGQGTSDRPLQEQHVESLHAESLKNGVAGDGNTITAIDGDAGEYRRVGILPIVAGVDVNITDTDFTFVGNAEDFTRIDLGSFGQMSNQDGDVYVQIAAESTGPDSGVARVRGTPESEISLFGSDSAESDIVRYGGSASSMMAEAKVDSDGDEITVRRISISLFERIEQ